MADEPDETNVTYDKNSVIRELKRVLSVFSCIDSVDIVHLNEFSIQPPTLVVKVVLTRDMIWKTAKEMFKSFSYRLVSEATKLMSRISPRWYIQEFFSSKVIPDAKPITFDFIEIFVDSAKGIINQSIVRLP